MIFRLFIPLAVCAGLAACGPAPTSPQSVASRPAVVERDVPMRTPGGPTKDIFTPYESGPLALDEYSVGPIMAPTEFSLDAIKPRFPKAEVKAAFLGDGDGSPIPIITVEQGAGRLEIQANPGSYTVGDIRVMGGTPMGPRGETLLMKWADADLDPPRCWMGKERDVHAVICTQPGEPVLRYVFGVPGWTQDTLPPVETLRQKAVLREFIWKGGGPPARPAVP